MLTAMRDDPDDVVDRQAIFERHRARLHGLAYRILGARADADDVVQDCALKWLAAAEDIANPAAWLTTALTRRAIDVLRSAHRSRVDYVGEWLPEPVETATSPEDDLALASSVSTAFLLVLERLSPKERAAFLLHDVFDMPHADVAETIGVSEPACRKLVSRAKAAVQARDVRHRPDVAHQRTMLSAFQTAIQTGDPGGLAALLAQDVLLRADGGGKAAAIIAPVEGAAVLPFITRKMHRWWAGFTWSVSGFNGLLGVTLRSGEHVVAVVTFGYDAAGRVAEIQVMRNPDKLRGLADVTPPDREPSIG